MQALRIAVLAGVALVLTPAGAKAQAVTHGCTCIENQTPITINYEFRWGDAAFTKAALNAGGSHRYCWKYLNPNDHASPPLRVRYDYALNTQGVQLHDYVLDRTQAANPQNCTQVGKVGSYHFRRTNNNTQIQLSKVAQ